jgi:hypothetical protein
MTMATLASCDANGSGIWAMARPTIASNSSMPGQSTSGR